MRLPFLRPKSRTQAERAPAVPDEPGAVGAARTQARRRLVGAVVLLVIGVVGFPVLFETQPRPLPVDTPFELPHRDATPAAPAPPLRPLPVTTQPADADTELTAPSAASAAAAPAPVLAPAPAPAPASTMPATSVPAQPVTARTAAPASAPARTDDGARARALLEGSAAAPAAAAVSPALAAAGASAPAAGRFVVQVGAYSDAGKLHEARLKVEKLGLKTYTQVIENEAGKRTRVRVGPYATREEAEAAAAKVKRGGLPANVLTL